MTPILLLDYAGMAVFAATGALAASRKELDIIGFLFLATITGIGGGTFRDLILGVAGVLGHQPRLCAHLLGRGDPRLLHRLSAGIALQACCSGSMRSASPPSP